MKQIRLKTFETNSSSTHSLTFGGDMAYHRWIESKGDIKFNEKINIDSSMRFGWDEETFTDSSDLASYLWIWLVDKKIGEEDVDTLRNHPMVVSFFNGINRRTLHPLTFDDVVDTDRETYSIDGYIDHQSGDLVDKELECWNGSFDDFVEYFVWSCEVQLETDNDNHYDDDNY